MSSVTRIKKRFISVQKVFWQLLLKLYDHVFRTSEVVEKTIFWKRQSFQWKKQFGLFFVLAGVTNLGKSFKRFHKVFLKFLSKTKGKIISLGPKMSSEKKTFQNKSIFPVTKDFGSFFSYYRAWQTSGNILSGWSRSCGNHCASWKIFSVTPTSLLKTQLFDEHAIFQVKKNVLAHFFSYNRVWQTSENIL